MAHKRSSSRGERPHAFAAKISNYQFEKVLWQFVLDRPERQATRFVRLSENSIASIYAKLRRFFFGFSLFPDYYKGADPRAGLPEGNERAELDLIAFHLRRVRAKRGRLDAALDGPDHHFAESCWRHGYELLRSERPEDHVDRLMFHHALSFIRAFGPVGSPGDITPMQRRDGFRLALEQMDQQILWLERNAAAFRDPGMRSQLKDMRSS